MRGFGAVGGEGQRSLLAGAMLKIGARLPIARSDKG
jgi:hypothetical protein